MVVSLHGQPMEAAQKLVELVIKNVSAHVLAHHLLTVEMIV